MRSVRVRVRVRVSGEWSLFKQEGLQQAAEEKVLSRNQSDQSACKLHHSRVSSELGLVNCDQVRVSLGRGLVEHPLHEACSDCRDQADTGP